MLESASRSAIVCPGISICRGFIPRRRRYERPMDLVRRKSAVGHRQLDTMVPRRILRGYCRRGCLRPCREFDNFAETTVFRRDLYTGRQPWKTTDDFRNWRHGDAQPGL